MNGYCLEVIRGIDLGKRYSLSEGAITIGRSEDNTLKFNEDELLVSNHHAIFYNYPGNLFIQDLNSRNGLFLNGERSGFNEVFLNDVIGFGVKGPLLKLLFLKSDDNPEWTSQNLSSIPELTSAKKINSTPFYTQITKYVTHKNSIDTDALVKVSQQKINPVKPLPKGNLEETQPNKVNSPYIFHLKNKNRLFTLISSFILLSLIATAFIMFRFILHKTVPDPAINHNYHLNDNDIPLNQSILKTPNTNKNNSIIGQSTQQTNLTNLVGPVYGTVDFLQPYKDTIETYLNKILSVFGQVDYQIPPQMITTVKRHLEIFSKSKKTAVSAILRRKTIYFPMIQRIFSEKNIPPQLAYISMLESGLNPIALSHAGAKGLWQLMPHTARRYGLKIDNTRDERIDPEAATFAAAEYLQDLIGIFGGKSSIMLVMAAYNAGERRVMEALRKIEDPIRNRDFWYIYEMGYLTEETNEYIPRILALMIIDENREHFGFSQPSGNSDAN